MSLATVPCRLVITFCVTASVIVLIRSLICSVDSPASLFDLDTIVFFARFARPVARAGLPVARVAPVVVCGMFSDVFFRFPIL